MRLLIFLLLIVLLRMLSSPHVCFAAPS